MIKQSEKKFKLDLVYGFGSVSYDTLQDSICLFEENQNLQIVYLMGKYIVIKQLADQQTANDMKLLKIADNLEEVYSVAFSPNKKYVAICQKLLSIDNTYNKRPVVQIFNFRLKDARIMHIEKKELVYEATTSDRFKKMVFSADGRFLACFTGEPDYQLVYLDLNNPKKKEDIPTCTVKFEIHKISINPKQSHQIVVSGGNSQFFLLYQQENGFENKTSDIKGLNMNQDFTDHCFLEDGKKILLGTVTGNVYIIKEALVIQSFDNIFHKNSLGVNLLFVYSKGFIAGSSKGVFNFYYKSEQSRRSQQRPGEKIDKISKQDKDKLGFSDDDKEYIYFQKIDSKQSCPAIAMDRCSVTSEETIAFHFSNNNIATFKLKKLIRQVDETFELMVQNDKFKAKIFKLTYISKGFHNGPISAMAVCAQRPLIATCCTKDSTIRIWNYYSYRSELIFTVQNLGEDKVYSLAFHPNGYYLAVGFQEKLRVYHPLNNQLRPYIELAVKSCTLLKFSNGGHILAAACPRNKSTAYVIIIYSAWTLEKIQELVGHKQQIVSLEWGPRDEFLITCSSDGAVIQWLPDGWKIKKEKQLKTTCSDLVYDQITHNMIASGGQHDSGNLIFIRDPENISKEQKDDPEFVNLQFRITHFTVMKTFHNIPGFVGGTNRGHIKSLSHEIDGGIFDSVPAHLGEVTQVCISPNGKLVFSGGQDGTICIFQVIEFQGDTILKSEIKGGLEEINQNAKVVDDILGEVVLVDRKEIDIYLNEQKDLRTKYEDLDNRMEQQNIENQQKMQKQMDEMKEKMNLEIQVWSRRYEELKEQKTKIEKESANLLKNMENNHYKAVEELESLYEKKLAFENEKYLQQEAELLEERLKFDQKLKLIENKHQTNIESLKVNFDDNFNKAQNVYENTKKTAEELKDIYEERLAQQEEEHEMEIKELKEKQKIEVEKLTRNYEDMKARNNTNQTTSKQVTEDLARKNVLIEQKDIEIQNLTAKLNDANSQIVSIKNDIEQFEEVVKKKEKKIHEYKYKINDLQKSKHILSFRTTEMRKNLEPKEQQIEKLKEELFKLENQMDNMIKQSHSQGDDIIKQKSQIESLNKSLKQQQEVTKQKDMLLNQIIMDIHDCVKYKELKEWPFVVQNLYQQYVQNQEIKQISHDPKGIDEMRRQIDHVEKSIFQLNKSSEKVIMRREKEIYKKTKENAELIYDINDQRKRNKELETEVASYKIQYEKQKKELALLKEELQRIKGPEYHKKTNIQFDSAHKMNDIFEQEDQFRKTGYNPPNTQFNNLVNGGGGHQRPQSMKIQKGKIIKGANFDSKTLGTFDKAKMIDMMAEMELSTQKVVQCEYQIKLIRNKIKRHVQEKQCTDVMFEEEIIALINQEQQFGDDMHSRPVSSQIKKQ